MASIMRALLVMAVVRKMNLQPRDGTAPRARRPRGRAAPPVVPRPTSLLAQKAESGDLGEGAAPQEERQHDALRVPARALLQRTVCEARAGTR